MLVWLQRPSTSLPGRRIENGGLHPVTRTIDRIESFFGELGFTVATARKSKMITTTSMR
jgi:phenylalanyl-tRNA synthetase alpha subunit